MRGTGVWIFGGIVGATALWSLFVAAQTQSQGVYIGGLVYFAFAMLFLLALISRGYDKANSGH